ncbi:MAG: hypothetical protein OEU95_04530 [Nitrospirota bacterium]|nr:hypothetical protein [Nitrospirota bacterium]
MTAIGKISRPDIEKYRDRKKIYFVKNIYLPQNANDKYRAIFDRYWKEVDEHLEKLETAGKISKIFCESIYMTGEKAMKVLKAMNAPMEKLVKKRIAAGGEFIPLEDEETFGAYIDWNNCLMLVRTPGVYKTIHEHFDRTVKARHEHIRSVLQQNIKDGEAGLLIMREEDRERLEVPDDIEFFYVMPPAYDDLIHYIQDRDSGTEYWRT